MKMMNKTVKIALVCLLVGIAGGASAQVDLNSVIKDAQQVVQSPSNLSNDDIVGGLKQALNVGTNNSTASASKVDGYYKNPKISIPFPKEAQQMKNTLDKIGMQAQTSKFVETLNRGAEEAAKNAAPIFLSAITSMSLDDGLAILKGSDSAATMYLKAKTLSQLTDAFRPVVKAALQKVDVTKYWNPLITAYDKVPFVKKQNPDLDAYVTQKALDGLFVLIAEEEVKIRKDPAAQVTDLLKKVFGGQ